MIDNSIKYKEIEGTAYCYEFLQETTVKKIAERVALLRKEGKISGKSLDNIRKYFRIKNIYNSNAIEGNALSIGETRLVVEQGLTITGKPLKDSAEAKNLSEALDYLEDLAKSISRPITESDIRQIHYLVLKGISDEHAGKYRTSNVQIGGSKYTPPSHESVAAKMEELAKWLAPISQNGEIGTSDALIFAAIAHAWFVYIHPFIDGNGRVARLLMNLILMRYGYPIAIITKDDRLRYYDALETSQEGGDLSAFLSLLTECISESLEEYELAGEEQREIKEWAASLAAKFTAPEMIKNRNEYEVWKNAVELLKSYFRQIAEELNEAAGMPIAKIYFNDFGTLELEKYLSLRTGGSAKQTWFFRLDFVRAEKKVRFLFFFGSPSHILRDNTDVTLHISREEPSGSYRYLRLTEIDQTQIPDCIEIGYKSKNEIFIVRGKTGTREEKADKITRRFFEDVIQKHFN